MSKRPDGVRLQAVAGSGAPAVLLAIKAVPGAKRERIVGPHGGALKVMVTQPPEGGAANKAICRLIAEQLGISQQAVTVIAGPASPWKTLRIEGVTTQAVRQALSL